MNDKYYTPTIEEFHVGFEFEHEDIIESGASDYFKATITDSVEIGEVFYNLMEHELDIRVKYLDREDIEEYFDIEISNDSHIYGKRKTAEIIYEIETYGAIEYRLFKIWWNSNHGTITFFTGKIKNKSELKRLLQQLKIIK